ncbi:MAG: DUF542 domain-containing protein [Bacteroidota bacterium]
MRVTEKTTISEIVRESYNTAELFEKNRIDFCCGGDNSLEKACQKAGVDTGKIIPELESLMEEGDWDSRYVERLPLDELCDYIMGRHHTYINEKSPFITQKLNK